MKKKLKKNCTLYAFIKDRRPGRKQVDKRAAIAYRFKCLCLNAGMRVPEVAQALQVTERTVYAWISGETAVPYSAYKLLRIQNLFELPGRGWEGWSMHSGKLWTPEGFGLEPTDSAWWGLLVRKAAQFGGLYRELSRLERRIQIQPACGPGRDRDESRRGPPAGPEVLVTPQVLAKTGHAALPVEVPVTLQKRLTDEPGPLDVASNTSKVARFRAAARGRIGGAR